MADLDAALAGLDFDVLCSLTHAGQNCTRPAVAVANVHECWNDAGSRRPVCGYVLQAAKVIPWPVHCSTCGRDLNAREDYLWNIEPL